MSVQVVFTCESTQDLHREMQTMLRGSNSPATVQAPPSPQVSDTMHHGTATGAPAPEAEQPAEFVMFKADGTESKYKTEKTVVKNLSAEFAKCETVDAINDLAEANSSLPAVLSEAAGKEIAAAIKARREELTPAETEAEPEGETAEAEAPAEEPTGDAPTIDDVRAALAKVNEQVGFPEAKICLGEFKANKVSELAESDFAGFIALCERTVAEKAD